MSLTKLFAFNTPANYTYDPLEIEVANGIAKLVSTTIISPANFEELFAADAGFTYDALKAEFSGGKVQQIQQTYKGTPYYIGTFFADYASSIDGDYGDGVLTGTPAGGASISGNKLDLTGGGVRYVDYASINNAPNTQLGCVRFKVTPNYSGSPALAQYFFYIFNNATSMNAVSVSHGAGGNLVIDIVSSTAVVIISVNLGIWVPVSGTEYEIELNWDITSGATRLFVDGVQFGATQASTGVRSSAITKLRVGSFGDEVPGVFVPNFYINDLVVYSGPQHTAGYTPSAYGLLDPQDPTFYAGFSEDINGDWGDGVLNGTAIGGASVSGGKLALDQDDLRYVSFVSASNVDSQQTGCIRFRVTPNYAGTPVTTQTFFAINETGFNNNELTLYHQTGTGNLVLNQRNATGASEAGCSAVWNPALGTEYEIEINYDLTGGKCRVFIGGVLHSSNLVTTGTRGATLDHFVIGTNWQNSVTSNFTIRDFLFFDNPQHVAGYVPSWVGIQAYEYEASKVELPQFVYAGLGSLLSFTNFVTTEAGTPKYVINDLYYSGAWVASNGTYAQSNTKAEILAQIASLPLSDTVDIDINFTNGIGTVSDVDLLQLTYTGNVTTYPTTDPIISPIATLGMDALQIFTEATTIVGSDAIKYILKKDGVKYYYSGAWVVSDGTYAQSNTAAEITAQIATFTVVGTNVNIDIILHSDTGLTTPETDSLTIGYDFGPADLPVHQTILWWDGMFSDTADDTVIATIKLNNNLVGYGTGVAIRKQEFTITPIAGRYEIPLVDTENMDKDSKGVEQTYILKIGKTKYSINIPATDSANLYDTGVIVG